MTSPFWRDSKSRSQGPSWHGSPADEDELDENEAKFTKGTLLTVPPCCIAGVRDVGYFPFILRI